MRRLRSRYDSARPSSEKSSELHYQPIVDWRETAISWGWRRSSEA